YGSPQTRRRLGGRQPLCGIGVTSRIVVTVKPIDWNARSADSRPEPGPQTSTSRVRMPCSMAFLPASSAAICAAKGVDLRLPLKPIMPAEDHEIALPWASVIVIIVLLNVEFTWATPDEIFFRSFRLTRTLSFAIRPEPSCHKGKRDARAPRIIKSRGPVTSSCRQSLLPGPCGCGHWCGCAVREPEAPCDGAGRDSNQDPSTA